MLQTALNMLNELEGSGLLGMPYALRLGGWASIPCLGAVGGMAGFTGWALAKCMYDENGERVRDSYRGVGEACFGRAGDRAVVAVQMANPFGDDDIDFDVEAMLKAAVHNKASTHAFAHICMHSMH